LEIADGDRYEVEYRDGKRHGRGVYVWANGDRYEGDWKDGKRHGRGSYVDGNGDRYEGDWKEGKADTVFWCLWTASPKCR
jgi:hypothetical protein